MLTEREREVLKLIAEGILVQGDRRRARRLPEDDRFSHRSNLMEKLDIHKVSGLVRFAIRAGLVEP